MKLKALSLKDLEQVRQWRNLRLEMLRTPFPLTEEQQAKFYSEVICNRQSNARYWGIWPSKKRTTYPDTFEYCQSVLIGMAGLENIQWENRLCEISLLLTPGAMDEYGTKSLSLLLHEGFMNMNLENIFTEVYECNPHLNFWINMAGEYNTCFVRLPNRKYYNGEYWPSYYINFNKEDYLEHENTILEPTQTLD